jgi:hypothetical protein
MKDGRHILAFECPTDEISAYIDGELDLVREVEMDAHFAVCQACTLELNRQKQFLCGLNASLNQEKDIELPAGFTKSIVANAESTVTGVRRPRELYNAMFICVGLLLFVLFAMGPEASRLFDGLARVVDQLTAVGGVFGRLIYSVFLGVAIVVRSIAGQVPGDIGPAVMLLVVLAAVFMYLSRKALRLRRV